MNRDDVAFVRVERNTLQHVVIAERLVDVLDRQRNGSSGIQDFTVDTPNHYMVRLAPIQRAEFRIYAEKPNAQVRRHLVMEIGEPCLLLKRHTWVGEHVATSVTLWHPASRFHLAGTM
ncbi:UTRA domain-containing protein [Burkholderia vietnamiensis]|uniref:UTRA domain-containing protein n=1 Tax=Burkholderia vietnamiensis TaxID=60552 RepID=UPI00244577EB|nr:UTRA domain-containing protein [Burkholderia vietnamiensis]